MSRLSLSEPETPASTVEGGEGSSRAAMRSPMLKGCGINLLRVDRDGLRRRVWIPARLRAAMADAVRSKDPQAAAAAAMEAEGAASEGQGEAPAAPLIVFVNSRSGERNGPVLKGRLLEFIGEEQVAGGDGTVGWVLGSLGELYFQKREPVPPTGIVPLGTGNDLARSFGWGGSFSFTWKSAVKRWLYRVASGQICHLDSWHVVVSTPEDTVELPHSLRHMGECTFNQDRDIEGELPDKVSCFEGVFYNYFSIGMDAQVAYGFHQLRDEKPHLAQSQIANKEVSCI